MADFNAIVQDVFAITNRPDLVKETQLAVKSATLQLHRQDFFYKDILEVTLQFDTADYIQSIDYRTLFPGYRALKYLRKYDPTKVGTVDGPAGAFFTVVTPEEVLDTFNTSRSDIVYGAGEVLQIKSSTKFQYVLIGIYQNPVVTPPEKYKSWVADEAYYAVVYAAAANVFGTVLGDAQRQRTNRDLAAAEFEMVKNSNIIVQGH